jgi:hypothetical protein
MLTGTLWLLFGGDRIRVNCDLKDTNLCNCAANDGVHGIGSNVYDRGLKGDILQ